MVIMAIMNHVHITGLDLNLLVALDALLAERNVTRAAGRIGITQSAMSHALSRLRELTGDALLVRTRKGMVPTPRAEALGPPIRRALDEVTRALAPPPAFAPRTAKRRFVVGTSDYGEFVLLPRLAALLEREAPGIDLRVRAHGADFVTPLSGDMDLAVAPAGPPEGMPGVRARRLFDDRFVCVVRKGHPLARKRLTMKLFAAASHVLISPREKEGGYVDEALAKHGLSRRVAVMVPHFLIAPHVVAATDYVLTLAERIAARLAEPLGLAALAPPEELALEGFSISALWHERLHDDPAHRFLRDRLAFVSKET
jgi:DNA-binding transcriptional LysR family regulator